MPNPLSSSLEQLRPIHMPDTIGYWPIAWGWWCVFGLVVLMLLGGGYWLWRHYQQGLPKRKALQLLADCEALYQVTSNEQQACATIVDILKRVALAYFSREEVAELYGETWVYFLQKTGKHLDFLAIKDMVVARPYMSASKDTLVDNHDNMNLFFRLARSWVAQRSKPCLY